MMYLRLPKNSEQAPSYAWQRIQKCYLYAKSTSQCARKLRTSYALIGNQAIWLVAPDSRNLTQVHDQTLTLAEKKTKKNLGQNSTYSKMLCFQQ